MDITFLGAAGTITGSRYLVRGGGGSLLVADVVREEGDGHPRRVEKMLEEISEPVGLPR